MRKKFLPLKNRESQTLSQIKTQQQYYLQSATSDNTRKTYQSAIRHFQASNKPLPATSDDIIHYLVSYADELNPRTLSLRISALSQWHSYQGFTDPTQNPLVKKILKGIHREHGMPKEKAKALSIQDIVIMGKYLLQQEQTALQARNFCLLLLGFFGAFRRSELIAINKEDITWEDEGIIIQLARSKTDQYGKGIQRVIPYAAHAFCPVIALKNWLSIVNIEYGPIFRPINRWDQIQNKRLSAGAINLFLKKLATACQLEDIDKISSHSLRRGLSTSAARLGVDFAHIKKQGGWKNDNTVWEYIEEGEQFNDNASKRLLDAMQALLKK